MLYKRYSDPVTLLQHYFEIEQFDYYISELLEIIAEEQKHEADDLQERVQWEFYLHRVLDQTYDEFVRAIRSENNQVGEIKTADMNEIETTVKRSNEIMELFVASQQKQQ